jgi:hypothetical protein
MAVSRGAHRRLRGSITEAADERQASSRHTGLIDDIEVVHRFC